MHNIKIADVWSGIIKINFYIRANDKFSDEIICFSLESEDIVKTIIYLMNLTH